MVSAEQPGAVSKQESVETIGIEREVQRLSTPEFRDALVLIQTKDEHDAVQQHEATARSLASKEARKQLDALAAEHLGVTVEEGRKRGKAWGQALREVGAQTADETNGKTYSEYYTDYYLQHLQALDEYIAQHAELAKAQEAAERYVSESLEQVVRDLENRHNDPDVQEALATWENCPDAKGEIGDDGLGYNAGIIHFFEYRTDPHKYGRFQKLEEPFSVDGFIAFTKRYREELRNIGSGREGYHEAVLQDAEGNQRVLVYTPDKELIVAFQRPGDPEPKLASVRVRQKMNDFDNSLADILAGKDRGVLNVLGPEVHRVL